MSGIYYNGVGFLNSNCPIGFSIGNRSTGKTFYWKRHCVKLAIEKGRKFIYIRRRKVDLEKMEHKRGDQVDDGFFKDIGNKFPQITDSEFKKGVISVELNGDGEYHVIGYYYHLLELASLKSMAQFEEVDFIFFDEFLPDDLRYLRPSLPFFEAELLLSLYFTVARGYGKVVREDVRMMACANNVTLYNPIFSYFKIDLTTKERGIFNYVYAERIMNEAVANQVLETKFGQIIKDTAYGKYAIGNQSLKDTKRSIKKRTPKAHLYMQIFFHQWYSLWCEPNGDMIFSTVYDETRTRKWQLSEPPDSEYSIPKLQGQEFNRLRKVYANDQLYYETPAIKSALHGIFERRT